MDNAEMNGYVSSRNGMRIFCQGLGLLLVIVSSAVVLQILFKSLKVLDKPSSITVQVEDFQVALHLEDTDVGKAVAGSGVVMWTGLCVWICLSLLHAGAKLVIWNLDEKQMKRMVEKMVGKG